MITKKIYNEDGQGFYRVFPDQEVVNVNPLEYYRNYELHKKAILLKDLVSIKDPLLASYLDYDFYLRNATKDLEGFFEEFENVEVPEEYLELLKTTRKKDQVKILKGMTLNPDLLTSLIFKSYKDFGFLYSKYLFENHPQGYDNKKLPLIFELKEDGTIEKTGETDFTDGELKYLIENRKVIISHFFQKDNVWHCFFTTHNSIGGKESWKNGQAHFHYISSAFGISREEFIESMRTGKYRSTSIHIDLLEYGKQAEK